MQSQRRRVCKCTKKLHNYNLEEDSTSEDCQKHIVLQYALEDIYLFHLPGADLIENLMKKIAF